MRTVWRARASGDRHGVPVEMRFIDLFMAAIGALIFMAMLLITLVRDLPPPTPSPCAEPPCGEPAKPVPFAIVTRVLPAARVGVPYEVVFAYRGGTGAVAWEVVAGQADLPDGLRFDADNGVLSGTPTDRRTGRFVLRARNGKTEDQRPFDVVVEPPAERGGKLSFWFGLIASGLAFLAWIVGVASVQQLKERLAALRRAYSGGRSSVTFEGLGRFEEETVYLPQGIRVYEVRLATARRVSRVVLLAVVLLTAWFVWRTWIA